MIRKAAPFVVLAALAFAPGAALYAQGRAPDDTITTGYWKYETVAAGLIHDTDLKCVGPADVDAFFAGPCNRHNTCTYPIKQVAAGKARYEGYWTDKKGKRSNVKISGTYSAKRFELSGTIKGPATLNLSLPAKITATWQSDTCPEGSKH
ncbi:MAG: DUF3617 family protein [Alphaproteobacteria bacterium]